MNYITTDLSDFEAICCCIHTVILRPSRRTVELRKREQQRNGKILTCRVLKLSSRDRLMMMLMMKLPILACAEKSEA